MEEKKETQEIKKPEEKREYRPRGDRPQRPQRRPRSRRGGFFRKKVCFFCKNADVAIDYKDVNLMKRFVAESGKISPRRFTGTCAKHQRKLSVEIKKARQMALIPFTDKHK